MKEPVISWPLDPVTQKSLIRWLKDTPGATLGGSSVGAPGGSTTQIQFNDSSAFGGDAGFTWDKTTDTLTVGLANANATIQTPSATAGDDDGGGLYLIAGNGFGFGQGGIVSIDSGDAGADGSTGGDISLSAGVGVGNRGGHVLLVGGNGGGAGPGGDITLTSGTGGATNAAAGDIEMTPSLGGGSGRAGDVVLGRNLTTTSRAGNFVYIPTSAGAPTGTPTTNTGRVAMVYDTTNNEFYIYNGAWKKVALA